MKPLLIAPSVFALLAMLAPAAVAAPPPDTVAVVASISGRPVLALEPGTGVPHVAYVSSGSLVHAWKVAGVWNSEVVSDSVSIHSTLGGVELSITLDGRPVAVFLRNGTLFCAVRGAVDLWVRDALDASPGPYAPVA